MSAARRSRSFGAPVAALALALLAPLSAAQEPAFMPKGGRTLLLQLFGEDAARLRAAAGARRSEAQWQDELAASGLSERERATLAAYLEVHMPLPAEALGAADLAARLPPDGRALAANECQSCHSLFTSHLTQSRDVQGWRNLFLSPFHRQMKMSPREREEFARYSAINMPMRIDDVPPDMRF